MRYYITFDGDRDYHLPALEERDYPGMITTRTKTACGISGIGLASAMKPLSKSLCDVCMKKLVEGKARSE